MILLPVSFVVTIFIFYYLFRHESSYGFIIRLPKLIRIFVLVIFMMLALYFAFIGINIIKHGGSVFIAVMYFLLAAFYAFFSSKLIEMSSRL